MLTNNPRLTFAMPLFSTQLLTTHRLTRRGSGFADISRPAPPHNGLAHAQFSRVIHHAANSLNRQKAASFRPTGSAPPARNPGLRRPRLRAKLPAFCSFESSSPSTEQNSPPCHANQPPTMTSRQQREAVKGKTHARLPTPDTRLSLPHCLQPRVLQIAAAARTAR